MMSEQQVVQKIVKDYFSSAVIIDDNLELGTNQYESQEEFSDSDFGIKDPYEFLTEESEQEAAPASENQYEESFNTPFETYQEFIREGFVTLPWKYTNKEDISVLKKSLDNSKLLIVDWNLEPSFDKSTMGDVAIELINSFISSNKGLKCAVIYTQEDAHSVQAKLENTFICKKIEESDTGEDLFIFEERDSANPKSLFGIIMSKKTNPENIIKNIAQILLNNKSITIHLMESANLLNTNLNRSMTSFNTPFEKVLFTQMVTSNLSNNKISQFINETLISSVIESDNSELDRDRSNFLFEVKRRNLIKKLNDFDQTCIDPLMKLLNVDSNPGKNKIPLLFTNSQFISELKLDVENSVSLKILKEKLSNLLRNNVEEGIVNNRSKFINLNNDVLLFTMFLDDYNSEEEAQFVESFQKQSLTFTKILKFISFGDKKIKTGSIIENPSDGKYLLCITPLCDTERPEEVGNKFKFLVGDKIDKPTQENLKNNKSNCYFMPLPIEEDLFYIKWNFFDTCTIELSDIEEESLIILKKDYVQNIINRYIAYQSRAGINEIFYKESSFISNFKNLI
jgi:hypothetical protein